MAWGLGGLEFAALLMIMQSQYMLSPALHPHRGLRLPVTLYGGDVPDAWRHALQALPTAEQARVAVLCAQGLRFPAHEPGRPSAGPGGLGSAGGRLRDPSHLRAAVLHCAAQEACDALWVQLPAEADPAEWAAWFGTTPALAGDDRPESGWHDGGADLCCLVAVVACLNARHLSGELARDTLPLARLVQVEFASRVVLLAEAGLAPPAQQRLRQWLHAWNPGVPVQTHFSALASRTGLQAQPDSAGLHAGPPPAPVVCAPCTSLGLPACPPGSTVLARLQAAGLDPEALAAQAGWAHVLEERPWPKVAATPGSLLQTLLFESRDPFHPQRLLELLCRPWPGLLRQHGYVWLATRPDWVVALSGHHRLLSVEPAGRWWAALPAARWPQDTAARQALLSASVEPWGDRCQRIAFIGTAGFDAEAMSAALTACQLRYDDTHTEIVAWRGLRDPLPAWHACEDEEDTADDARTPERSRGPTVWQSAAASAGMR